MKSKSSLWISVSCVIAAACLIPPANGFAQSYTIRPNPNPSAQCKPNTLGFGYNDTNWRTWPLQPRPEERDAKTVGGSVIPAPPPIVERPLPHAEDVPAKPSSEGSGGGVLPSFQGITTPSTSAGTGRFDGGTGSGTILPGNTLLPDPGLAPSGPDRVPKTDNKDVQPTPPRSDSLLPGALPSPLTTPPGTPSAAPARSSDSTPSPLKAPAEAAPPPAAAPDAVPAPSPAAKPDPAPSPTPSSTPTKGFSSSEQGEDAVAATAPSTQDDSPMQANWDASLVPEAVGGNHLRSASFEQQAAEKSNPLRCGLEGFCPVELIEKDRWVAGNPEYQMSYQGQVFHFSSEAARRQFQAAPEKYAPIEGGNDVVLIAEENRSVPGSVNHSALWRGRLFLFSNSATLAEFQKNPPRYATRAAEMPADSQKE